MIGPSITTMSGTTTLLASLVAIDSVNPSLVAGAAGEKEIARFVLAWLQDRGIATQAYEAEPGRPSVVARVPGKGGGRSLMLYAHMDTVGVSGMPGPFDPRIEDGGTDQRTGVSFDQQHSGAVGRWTGNDVIGAYSHAARHAEKKPWSQVEVAMWRGEARRGRAGQAFEFGEPGVVDGATANSLAAGRHGPRQGDQIVKTKPLTRSCLRVLDQSLEPTRARSSRNRPLEQPGTIAGRSQGWAGRPLPITPDTTHFRSNIRSGR